MVCSGSLLDDTPLAGFLPFCISFPLPFPPLGSPPIPTTCAQILVSDSASKGTWLRNLSSLQKVPLVERGLDTLLRMKQ